MEKEPLTPSPRWKRLERADTVLIFRDTESGATMARVRREHGTGSRSREVVWILLSAHFDLLGVFEENDADPTCPPWERAELAIREWYLRAEEESRGPSAVDFSHVYSLLAER